MQYDYCLGFAFNPDHTEVLLITKQKPAWQKGKVNGIGGKLEPYELAIDAMRREFKEECGVETEIEQWGEVCIMRSDDSKDHPDKDEWRVTVFTAELFDTQYSNWRSCTAEEVFSYDVTKLCCEYGSMHANLRWLIPLCLDMLENNINYIVYN